MSARKAAEVGRRDCALEKRMVAASPVQGKDCSSSIRVLWGHERPLRQDEKEMTPDFVNLIFA